MQETVFKVYAIFYTKPRKQRRKVLNLMLKWCFKEYLNTFKKDEIPVNVITNEITNINS